MRIPNVSQRKDSANSERIQQFCTCKKRSLLCCAIGCQCLRRLCYRGSNDPKAGGRRQQAEASSLRQCLATIPSRTLGSMGGWDYLLAGEKPKSRVGRKWRAVGGLPLFEIQGVAFVGTFRENPSCFTVESLQASVAHCPRCRKLTSRAVHFESST